jgi:hypothetical protein
MNNRKQIKAISMLLIMLAMMMHNAFPHIHHQHESNDVAYSSGDPHEHHHDHGHEHKGSDQSEEDENHNLLDFLLTGHAHSSHSHQFTPVTVNGFKSYKVFVSSVFFLAPALFQFNLWSGREGPSRYSLFKQSYLKNPYLGSNKLRGPPSLG